MNEQSQKKILLVDNSTEYRRAIMGFLELEGYGVAEAKSSTDAQEILDTQQFDLVLVDLHMNDDLDSNDMSGLEIAKFTSEYEIPCIILTSFPTVEPLRTVLRSGGAEPFAKEIISKFSGQQELIDSIRRSILAGNSTTDAPPPSKKKKDK